MELHSPGQLNAVPAVADVLLRYLARLPLSGERRAMMFADALGHGATVARALARVHGALAAHAATAANAAHATIGARLRLAIGETADNAPPVTRDVQGRERLETTPRLARSPMAPHAWLGRSPRASEPDFDDGDAVPANDPGSRWRGHAL